MHPRDPSPAAPAEPQATLAGLFRLGAPTDLDAHEERAFELDRNRLMLALWPRIGLLIAAAALLWWPFDGLIFDDRPRLLDSLAGMRGSIVVLNLFGYAVGQTPLARRFTVPTVVAFICADSAMIGWWVGTVGPLDGQWFSYFFVFPVVTLMLVVGPRTRAMALVLMSLAYVGAAGLNNPATLAHRDFPAVVGFLIFVLVLSFMLGHPVYGLLRSNFAFQRRLAAQRDTLDALAAGLESRVTEQTDELRRLARRLEGVRESERKAVAAEIHDQLGQTLTAMRYGLTFARTKLTEAPRAADLALAEIQRLVAGTSESVRRLLARLNPRVLEELGLFAATDWLADESTRHSAIEARVVCEGDDGDIPAPVATGAFRIIQESITNALKHARANALHVGLTAERGWLRVRVRDDGRGPVDAPSGPGGLGLVGIRERAQTLGGRARWGPLERGGFEVLAELPLALEGGS